MDSARGTDQPDVGTVGARPFLECERSRRVFGGHPAVEAGRAQGSGAPAHIGLTRASGARWWSRRTEPSGSGAEFVKVVEAGGCLGG